MPADTPAKRKAVNFCCGERRLAGAVISARSFVVWFPQKGCQDLSSTCPQPPAPELGLLVLHARFKSFVL